MSNKYNNYFTYTLGKIIRDYQRFRLKDIVTWDNEEPLAEGVTAIIGVDTKLLGILKANLKCLIANQWSDLKAILIVVNQEKNDLIEAYTKQIYQYFPNSNIHFLYYV